MRTLFLILLLARPLAALPLDLVVNGSFELPGLASTQNLSGPVNLPGWTGWAPGDGGNAGLVVGTDNALAPADGRQHFTFNGGNPSDRGWLEQTLPTDAGAEYDLVFALGRAGGGQPLSLFLTVASGPSLLLSQSFLPPDAVGYATHAVHFTASTAATTLRFADTSGANSISDLYLDAVRVTPTPAPAAAVPDAPSPCDVLLALGALLLATRVRRA